VAHTLPPATADEAVQAPADRETGPRWRRVLAGAYLTWLPLLLVGWGVAVRVRQYLFRRSLWLDEAMVAIDIVNRSYSGLLQPLDRRQGAPVGWLWLEHTMVELLGNHEYSLRLVPLVAGLATIGVFWRLARELLPGYLVPVALAFVATSPLLIYYSTEAKQYSSDVLLGLVALALSLPLLGDRLRARDVLWWGAFGTIGLWCSHPLVMFLAGSAVVVLGVRMLQRDWRGAGMVALGCVSFSASFLACYAVSLARLGRDELLLRYWQEGFAPEPLQPGTTLRWLARTLLQLLENPVQLSMAGLASVTIAVGVAALLRRSRRRALLLLSPFPGFLLAAVLGKYPASGRLVLALVPLVLLLVVAAAGWGHGRLGLVASLAGATALAVLAVSPARNAAAVTLQPTTVNELRPVLETVKERRQPGDRIWVHNAAASPVTYYGQVLNLQRDGVFLLRPTTAACDQQAQLASQLAGDRVWLVFSHRLADAPADEHEVILSRFARVATVTDQVTHPGAGAYLVDPTVGPADPSGAHELPTRNPYCLVVLPKR
jgi:Dolichyl-phosphate-mannose-protein mannosyltransferase